jgi:xanthine dehydrogenase YagS FAD-binding subunit
MRAFVYERASSEAAAIHAASMLAQSPEAQGRPPVEYLAGGTTLVDLMKLDVMRPAKVVDLGALAGVHDVIPLRPTAFGLEPWSRCRPPPTIRRLSKTILSSPKACSSLRARNFATWRRLAAMCCNGPAARISAIPHGSHVTSAIPVRVAPRWTA